MGIISDPLLRRRRQFACIGALHVLKIGSFFKDLPAHARLAHMRWGRRRCSVRKLAFMLEVFVLLSTLVPCLISWQSGHKACVIDSSRLICRHQSGTSLASSAQDREFHYRSGTSPAVVRSLVSMLCRSLLVCQAW